MRQPCSSRRLVLTFERATARVSEISSAGSGCGERNSRAWTCATVRLMPQRVPISPQWRMNFWAIGVRGFGDLLVCALISVSSLYSEITRTTVRLSRCFLRNPAPRVSAEGEFCAGNVSRTPVLFTGFPVSRFEHTFLLGFRPLPRDHVYESCLPNRLISIGCDFVCARPASCRGHGCLSCR